MNIFMSKWVTVITLTFGFNSITIAADLSEFKKLADATIEQAKSGQIKNIDKLIKMQGQLLSLGKAASKNYGATNPKAAKMMKLIVSQAEKMKTLSLSQIEAQWHEKSYLKGKGIPDALLADRSKTGIYLDAVINPATTFILLSEYKATKDSKLLKQVVGELEEVLTNFKLK